MLQQPNKKFWIVSAATKLKLYFQNFYHVEGITMNAKQGLAAALLSTLVSAPAFASVGDIYVSGKFGLSWEELRDVSDSFPGHTQTPTLNSAKEDVLAYGGAVGYRFNGLPIPVRIEADYTFRNGLTYNPNPVYVGETDSMKSNVIAQTIMGNLLLDFPIIDWFGLFVGGGGGAALTTTENKWTDGTDTLKKDTDNIGVAWMATAGVSFVPMDALALDLSYRYTNLGSALWNISDTTVDLTSNNYAANEIFLTVRLSLLSEERAVSRPNPYQPKQWKEPAPQPKPVTKAPSTGNKSPAYNKAPEYSKAPAYNKQRAQPVKGQ
jgi:opacity protein-like surface antigen